MANTGKHISRHVLSESWAPSGNNTCFAIAGILNVKGKEYKMKLERLAGARL